MVRGEKVGDFSTWETAVIDHAIGTDEELFMKARKNAEKGLSEFKAFVEEYVSEGVRAGHVAEKLAFSALERVNWKELHDAFLV